MPELSIGNAADLFDAAGNVKSEETRKLLPKLINDVRINDRFSSLLRMRRV